MTEKVQQPNFTIQGVYVKNISFECPNSPVILKKDWKPKVSMGLKTANKKLEDNVYEATLLVTIEAKIDGDIAFVCEVQQAGAFVIHNLDKAQLEHCLNAFCPNILFPYARETVANLVARGSFPQFNLEPVNFDALFQQAMADKKPKGNKLDS